MITIGSVVPPCSLHELPPVEEGCPKAPITVDVVEALKDKTVVMFFIPGAYTPVCSEKHAPEFVKVRALVLHDFARHTDAYTEARRVHCRGRQRGALPPISPCSCLARLHSTASSRNTIQLTRPNVQVWCVSPNDHFVMHAWGHELDAHGKLRMLGDGNQQTAAALDILLDLRERGMGMRCRRAMLIAKNGIVVHAAQEDVGKFDGVSSATAALQALSKL
jgi:peroxiredoxin